MRRLPPQNTSRVSQREAQALPVKGRIEAIPRRQSIVLRSEMSSRSLASVNRNAGIGKEQLMGTRQADAEVLARSIRDPACFSQIFERHFRSVHSYLQRRCGTDVADDLAADVFVEAFRSRERYDPRWQDARPWLMGVATNLLRHHWRSQARQLRAYDRVSGDSASPSLADESDARIDARRHHEALAGALSRLSPPDRDVLTLYAWAGLSYEEIAQSLQIPAGTVRSRLARARRQIREALEPNDKTLGAFAPTGKEQHG